MSTHADVSCNNPSPSLLRCAFRPHQETFSPREYQWRGKIRPYQEIEYTVHGFPIALHEQGLSAYLFYAGATYERNGKIVDNFDNVRTAAAPILEEGIEFARTGRSSRVSC